MTAIDHDSARLFRYLLHDVTESEREEIETQYFRDPEALAMLDAMEGELIDAYVRRELTSAQRQKFERDFLSTHARRERLRMSEALHAHMPRRRDSSRVILAIAASLLALIALGVWMWTRTQPRSEIVRRPVPSRTPIETPRAPVTVAVTLFPGVPRDPATGTRVVLPSNAEQLRVTAPIEVEGEWRDLRATLDDSDWTAANLTMNADRTVTFLIPASTLAEREYILSLWSGDVPLSDYAFTVRKKNLNQP